MNRQELERLAYAGGEIPEGLGGGETLLFAGLRYVYGYYRLGGGEPDQERGRRDKLAVYAACKRYLLDQESAMEMARKEKKTEAARTAYRKAKTPEEALEAADRLMEALDGIPGKGKELMYTHAQSH